jgi:hypothetical protein
MGGERLRLVARACLTVAAVAVVLAMAPAWLALLRPDPAKPRDFFQDYASARNLLAGRPVYESQAVTMRDYLGLDTGERRVNVAYNAHPPTSVLLALPLAGLDYPTAGWWWNVFSLVLLAGSLAALAHGVGWRPTGWAVAPALALLLTWVPLWLHTLQGQLGLVLLALFTAAWAAGRRGHAGWAGACLGLAATIKLFPVLLLGLPALHGRWRGVAAGAGAGLLATAATLLIAGPRAYVDYLTVVIPNLERWRPDWINASLTGFFARLFAPDATTAPLLASPWLAAALTAAAGLAVIAAVVWRARRRRGAEDFDGEYALALTALLLLSALTWSHYFVVLLIPLVIWARRLWLAGRAAAGRWAVLVVTWGLMALPQLDLARALIPAGAASPALALTVLSLNFYGLLGFFIAQVWWLAPAAARAGSAAARPSTAQVAAPPEPRAAALSAGER